MKPYPITGGIYLVVDISMEWQYLSHQLEQALKSNKIAIIQIWNPTKITNKSSGNIDQIIMLSHGFNIPVLIHQDWQLLTRYPLDGVHFDTIPPNYESIKTIVGRPFLAGITLSNNLEMLALAEKNNFDYISFCSVFPSASAGSCELVSRETLIAARKLTSLPVFVSGGITQDNLSRLPSQTFDGIALVSGILKHPNPTESAEGYYEALSNNQSISIQKTIL